MPLETKPSPAPVAPSRIITPQQIEGVMQELLSCNIPVKSYMGIQNMFAKLPAAPGEQPQP